MLGLTAYRIHYTENLSNGDILTTQSHFYGAYRIANFDTALVLMISYIDPIIVELLVTSILALLFSLFLYVSLLFFLYRRNAHLL